MSCPYLTKDERPIITNDHMRKNRCVVVDRRYTYTSGGRTYGSVEVGSILCEKTLKKEGCYEIIIASIGPVQSR